MLIWKFYPDCRKLIYSTAIGSLLCVEHDASSTLAIKPMLPNTWFFHFSLKIFKLNHFRYNYRTRRALYFGKDKSSIMVYWATSLE